MQYIFFASVSTFLLLLFWRPFREIFFRRYPNAVTKLEEEEFYEQFENIMDKEEANRKQQWKDLIDKAWKTRDFEIELYWKRTNYFWLFQIPAFTAFFAINKTVDDITKQNRKPEEIFPIICLGVIFSTGWFLINKGSKAWQRHWEQYIDLIEQKYYGPFYQTVGSDRTFSVSKINEIVSFAFIAVWSLFLMKFVVDGNYFHFTFSSDTLNFTIAFSLFVTIILLCSMFFGYGRGYFGDRAISMYKRKHHYE